MKIIRNADGTIKCTPISNSFLDRSFEFSPAEFSIRLYLEYRMNSIGEDKIKISYSELSEKTGISRQGVQNSITALIQRGELFRIKSKTGNFYAFKMTSGLENERDLSDNYVYVMNQVGSNIYKIGYSKNPQKRLTRISSGSSKKIKIISVYPQVGHEQAEKSEKYLHDLFHKKRLFGEWFRLNRRDLKKIDNFFEGK